MHVGHTAIFQNPNQTVSDYQIYQEDMALAKECADTQAAAPPAFMAA